MPKGRALAAVEVRPGWVLDIDGAERTVRERQYGYPREGETERRIKIWFTDGYQVSGDEGQTIYVVSEGEKND